MAKPTTEKPKRYRSNASIGAEVAAAYNPNNPYGSWSGKGHGFSFLRSYNPDDLVKSKNNGIKIYQEMTREPMVKAALQQKTTSLLSVPWGVKPASTDPADVERAQFVMWNFKHLAGGFQRDIWEMCDALNVGYAVLEKVFGVVEGGDWDGMIRLHSLKSKDPYYFGFAFDDFMNLKENGVIMTMGSDGYTEKPLPADKFFIFSFMKKYENLYGQSDLRAAYRAFWIKDTAWKLRSVYMERFSGNNLKGKYPRNKDSEANKTALINIFKSWQNETGVAIPEDLEIEVLNVATSSDSEYARAMADCNVDIAVGILGETLTLNEGRKTGARNMGEIHKEVVDLFVLFLDMILVADINEQLVRPLVDMNYAGVTVYPEFYWYPREDYDPVAFGQAVLSWQQAGVKISKAWFYERTRMPLPTGEDDELEPEKPAPQGTGFRVQGTAEQEPEPKKEDPEPETEADPEPAKMAEPTSTPAPDTRTHGPGDSRPLSKSEQYAEIPKIDTRLKIVEDKCVAASRPAYGKIFADILKQVKNKDILASTNYIAAAKLSVNPGPLKDVLFKTLLTAHMMGRADVVTETQNQGFDFGKIKKFAEAFDWSVMDGPFTPEEAVKFFSGKVPMTRAEFDALTNRLMDKAFYVAGLDKLTIELGVKALLTDALNNGMTLDQFKFKLDEMQIKYATPVYGQEGTIGEDVLDYHAETVFRTNMMSAYNDGRYEMYQDPDVKDYFPAYEYTAIMDGRTTDICSDLDGKVYLADDPIWDSIWPPNHYNCRSTVVSINKFDFTRDMISANPSVKPAEGFGAMSEGGPEQRIPHVGYDIMEAVNKMGEQFTAAFKAMADRKSEPVHLTVNHESQPQKVELHMEIKSDRRMVDKVKRNDDGSLSVDYVKE